MSDDAGDAMTILIVPHGFRNASGLVGTGISLPALDGTVRAMFFYRHLGAKFEWRVAAEENGTLLESCVSELKGVSTREFEYQTCGRRWAASHVLSYRGRSRSHSVQAITVFRRSSSKVIRLLLIASTEVGVSENLLRARRVDACTEGHKLKI